MPPKLKDHTLRTVAEIIGVVSIVASLIFVGLQLQQERVLMRAELGAQSQELAANFDLVLADPEMADIWLKMLDSPNDLSSQEMIQINSVLRAQRRLFLRECYLVAMGVFGECESIIRGQSSQYFGSQYAQLWWRQYHHQSRLGADEYGTRALIDKAVTGADQSASKSILERIKKDG